MGAHVVIAEDGICCVTDAEREVRDHEVGPVRSGGTARAPRGRSPLSSIESDLSAPLMRPARAASTCQANGCDQLLELGMMHAEEGVPHTRTVGSPFP